MYKNLKRKLRGFTLIELLVTMGIIALLTSIVMFSMSEVRAQSRDKSRMVDLKQLELAMELYREANGRYPIAGCGRGTGIVSEGTNHGGACPEYIVGLAPTYIPKLPHDPKLSDTRGFAYRTDTNGTEYKVMVIAEVETLLISNYSDEFARCDASCSSVGSCEFPAIEDDYGVYVDITPGDGSGSECY